MNQARTSLRVMLMLMAVAGAFGMRSVCYAQENGALLQITAPVPGTVVTPGQTEAVSVSSSSNVTFSQAFVIADDPIGGSEVENSIPATFSVMVPADIDCGPHTLTAMGITSSGQTVTSPVVQIDDVFVIRSNNRDRGQ